MVDDSAVIRGLISRWLDEDENISVVGTASNGVMALKYLVSQKPEVVILDIEMPEMSGMEALPLMIKEVPDIKVIMASTLTRRNAEISMKALEIGAAEYVPKPESSREINASAEFRQSIQCKVNALGAALRKSRSQPLPGKKSGCFGSGFKAGKIVAEVLTSGNAGQVLRRASTVRPKILAIGSSTGGPQALLELLGSIKDKLTVPVVITQHMPATFTSILADHLARATGRSCAEARDGDLLVDGQIYVAPGGYHLTVVRQNGQVKIDLNQKPQENYCRPAVDPMLRSVAEAYGAAALAIILTGMGYDGKKGAEVLVGAGGTLLAQDEASSVVWGMPGAVTAAGLCSAVLPIGEIGPSVIKMMSGGGL